MLDRSTIDRLRAIASERFPAHQVLAAYVYGSRAVGRPSSASDLDVGYYLEGYRDGAALSVGDEMRLATALSDATGYEVDLRNLGEAPLELRGRVLEQGMRIFSGNDMERVALERDLLARYHDYKDVFRAMHELRLRSQAARRG